MLIAHLTDLSGDDTLAFQHAVALAVRCQARIASVHACVGPQPSQALPHVQPLLSRWGLGATLEHERIEHECCDDVTDTLLDALGKLNPDLIVAATHPRSWLARIAFGSVAEGVARNVRAPTLLLPIGSRGFVDERSGNVRLERALVPAGDDHDAARGVDAAKSFARLCGKPTEIVVVHAGPERLKPLSVDAPFTLISRSYAAPLAEAMHGAVLELEPDLIVMGTRGHDTLGDIIFGSHTERVLHDAGRPLLWVPLDAVS